VFQVAPGWLLDVDRGPDWLFIRIARPDQNAADSPPLADRIWSLLEESPLRRLVLELDALEILTSYVIGQMVLLHKRIVVEGGLMRISGLSAGNQEVLHMARLDDRFPAYRSREDAVLGRLPPPAN
jgi:anti-anti-sigma regulatory factor